MALTLTRGQTFGATEQVTNTKLHNLVDLATAADIDQTNLATSFGLVELSATAPTDTDSLWRDSGATNALKFHNGTAFVPVGGGAATLPIGASDVIIRYNTAAINTTVDIERFIGTSDDGTFAFNQTSTLSPIITGSGANGLDTGSEASDTHYAIWIIGDSNAVNANAGLFSTSFTSPTLPSGYDVKRLLGFVRNDGSSNFIPFIQQGTVVMFRDGATLSTSVGSTSFAAVSAANFVPSICEMLILSMRIGKDTGGAGTAADVFVSDGDKTGTTGGVRFASGRSTGASDGTRSTNVGVVALDTDQNYAFRATGSPADLEHETYGCHLRL